MGNILDKLDLNRLNSLSRSATPPNRKADNFNPLEKWNSSDLKFLFCFALIVLLFIGLGWLQVLENNAVIEACRSKCHPYVVYRTTSTADHCVCDRRFGVGDGE